MFNPKTLFNPRSAKIKLRLKKNKNTFEDSLFDQKWKKKAIQMLFFKFEVFGYSKAFSINFFLIFFLFKMFEVTFSD